MSEITIKDLKVGQRIYYTGDCQNASAWGTITEINQPTRWSGESINIAYDAVYEREPSLMVYPNSFNGIGRRFMTEAQHIEKYKMAAPV